MSFLTFDAADLEIPTLFVHDSDTNITLVLKGAERLKVLAAGHKDYDYSVYFEMVNKDGRR